MERSDEGSLSGIILMERSDEGSLSGVILMERSDEGSLSGVILMERSDEGSLSGKGFFAALRMTTKGFVAEFTLSAANVLRTTSINDPSTSCPV